MRLIRGHDFYDSAAAYGVDTTRVYVRKTGIRPGDRSMATHKDFPIGESWFVSGRSGSLERFILFIGSEVRGGLRVTHRPETLKAYQSPQVFHIYDEAEVDPAIELIGANADKLSRVFEGKKLKDAARECLSPVSKADKQRLIEWMIDNRVASGVAIGRIDRTRERHEPDLAAYCDHDNLKEMEAWKALDPFRAHMELSNFISGVLPSGPDLVEISDRDKIKKAGFDVKKSFRKAPQKHL